MRQNSIRQTLFWALYAIALFLIYHLLVKIAVIDLSWIALIVLIPVLVIGFFLFKPEERKELTVFTLGFLLLDRALTSLDVNSLGIMLVEGFLAILVIAGIAKWYGKLAWNAIFALVLVALLANVTFNRDNLAALNHFYVKWETDRLYQGEWVDYFPITLYDVDGDGKEEIITYGNKEEVPPTPAERNKPETGEERRALAEEILPLKPEPILPYVFTWKDNQLVRIPKKQIKPETMAKIKEQMAVDFPGFPYYTYKDDQLVPNVQRQSYAESMMQTGTAPYRAFLLDMQNIDEMLKQKQGNMDIRHSFGKESKFSNLVIRSGQLSGNYDGKAFNTPTKATKLINTMRLADGREGLIVLGENLSILTVEADGSVKEAYSLTRKQVTLSTSDIIIADIDHDKTDEMLVAGSPSYVLKPAQGGAWQILWASQDESFRFAAFDKVGNDPDPQMVAQAKSWVSSYDRRYLAGFHYTPEGLEQQWKIYLPLMNIQIGDIDGDKENEIIASIYDTHRLLVLKQHNIPVLPLVIALFIALLGYGVVRRFRHA